MIARRISLIVLVLFLGLAVGCTMNHTVTKKDQLLYMYKVYNAQYKDYLSMAEDPSKLTEEQKVMLRKKKPVLEQLGVLIPLYDSAIEVGKVTPEQEQQIYDLLNSLN